MTISCAVCDHQEDRHPGGGACILEVCGCAAWKPRRPPGAHLRADGRPKARYASRRLAKAGARRYPSSDHQHPYECETCNGWHLSSSPRRAGA